MSGAGYTLKVQHGSSSQSARFSCSAHFDVTCLILTPFTICVMFLFKLHQLVYYQICFLGNKMSLLCLMRRYLCLKKKINVRNYYSPYWRSAKTVIQRNRSTAALLVLLTKANWNINLSGSSNSLRKILIVRWSVYRNRKKPLFSCFLMTLFL